MIERVCGVVLLCAALSAQDKPAASAGTAPGRLDAFAPLIGRDWTAPLPKGNLTDTQRFEWVYGKKFIRNTHAVKTANGEVVYEGETVYAWDSRSGRIVWWYWNASTTATQTNSTAPGLPYASLLTPGPLPHPMRKTASGIASQRAPTASSFRTGPHRRGV